MVFAIQRHLVHHYRFYVALLIGGAVAALDAGASGPLRLIAAGDAFFAVYLVLIVPLVVGATPDRHRDRASYPDEGVFLIFLIIAAVIAISFAAVFAILKEAAPPSRLALAASILSIPLGWVTFHTTAAFHYAHRFYSEGDRQGGERHDRRGLGFPGTEEPGTWDFLYHAFVIGMTAQVSDVQISDTSMRRLALFHSAASFFFNTVILALVVSVVFKLASGS